ncbi:uncharacterized protein LOC112184972 [Rosa chinensis]|uniref:uncharacterized protein LOC112184972 n=1 Tax=Rosa chinensis TaxID=74649 RepID=UPI000D086E48|nr:uncharacterized protein LOC112184972 [Rosa chinensis]
MCDQTLLAVANIFLRSSLCMNYEVNRSKSEGYLLMHYYNYPPNLTVTEVFIDIVYKSSSPMGPRLFEAAEAFYLCAGVDVKYEEIIEATSIDSSKVIRSCTAQLQLLLTGDFFDDI